MIERVKQVCRHDRCALVILGSNQLLKRCELAPQLSQRFVFGNIDGAWTFARGLLGFRWCFFRLNFSDLALPLGLLFLFAGFALFFLFPLLFLCSAVFIAAG